LPPYGQYGAPQANWAPTPVQGQLADWGSRVLGYLVDAVIIFVPTFILAILGSVTTVFFLVIAYIVGIGLGVWFSVQVGQYGSSPGMRVIGLKCIKADTGQVIGGGMGFVRSLCHIVDGIICYIGYLWPLWDAQRQTLADKIIGTVVLKVPAEGFSLTPKSS
jgi:uncharacterized RDD family membrane protein YckC